MALGFAKFEENRLTAISPSILNRFQILQRPFYIQILTALKIS